MSNNELFTKIEKIIQAAADANGCSMAEVTKPQFFKEADGEVSEWELRKLGGFAGIKRLLIPAETTAVVARAANRAAGQHQRKLERDLGTEEFRRSAFIQSLSEVVKAAPIRVVKAAKRKGRKSATSRTLQACISDTHFGCVIEAEEMSGANVYNPTVAARRLAYFTQQIVEYKTQYRDKTDLVVQLNGDILAGIIHDQEWGVDLMTKQFHLALSLLSQAISTMAAEFGSVRVVCQPGNHGRFLHKTNKGRQTSKKWDNFETMLYLALSWTLKDLGNVEWTIPESPFAIYKAQNQTFFQTHGDTVINVGNPGSALSMKSINEQVNKFNAAAAVKIDALCVGHVHVATTQLLENGSHLVINGTMSGTDPFAQSIGIFSNNPAQVLFETTPRHAVGDVRVVTLKEADADASLDDIIEAPEGNF